MKIERATPTNELAARVLFLLLPTAFVAYFLINQANSYFSILQNQAIGHTAYFVLGTVGAAVLYSFRFRFLPVFAALFLLLYFIYQGINATAVGEFDTFFISIKLLTFSLLFLAGWVVGWGFVRWRYFSLLLGAALLMLCILVIAKQQIDTVSRLLWLFIPVLAYSIYIVFAAEQIQQYKDKSQRFWWFMSRRLLLFFAFIGLIIGGVVYAMKDTLKATVEQYGGSGKEGENSMLKKNSKGEFDLKNYAQLGSALSRNNELLFAAHIDNFFEGTTIPNPLYLTAFYYSKFDTTTETFERDTLLPKSDLFQPDVSKIPLYQTYYDTTIVANSMSNQLRKVVEVEVYAKKLSRSTFLAPHAGFFVQPVAVDKDFRQEFKFAFRAKSYVSELNSAYFIYNADNPAIKEFQQKRFDELRKVKSMQGLPANFYSYYTYMPTGHAYDRIKLMAKELSIKAGAMPIDRVLAVRDHFLSTTATGEPLFSYSDNPGIPDIPSASKLNYFLFENRKGYCAYYAGATLFLLRAMGIPSRIAVGFLTVDRSDKNKGWYWYYADQAHAWVQVFFPGYGWIDFDTTVGNREAQESPKPDGTPPLQPPKAWLAADGIIAQVDTNKKIALLSVSSLVFHDQPFQYNTPRLFTLDMRVAEIIADSVKVPISALTKGMKATAISYAESIKNMEHQAKELPQDLAKRLPNPIPTDEVYVKLEAKKQPDTAPVKPTSTQFSWSVFLSRVALGLGVLLLCILSLPIIFYSFYKWKFTGSKDLRKKAYYGYKATHYLLHQMGIERKEETALHYATRIDGLWASHLQTFTIAYLQTKYGTHKLSQQQEQLVKEWLPNFEKTIKKKLPLKRRLLQWVKPWRTFDFFFKKQNNHEPIKA